MTVDLAYRALLLIGVAGSFLLGYRAFERRSIQLGEEPTLPRYFAPRGLFRLGTVSYGVLVTLLFLALATVWVPIEPLVRAIGGSIVVGNIRPMMTTEGGRLLAPVLAVGVFFLLLLWDSRANPLMLLRDAVCDMFAIPRKAVEVYNVLRASRMSGVATALREQARARLLVPSLDLADFDRAADTVEYKWARNCLLFDQIQGYAERNSYRRFFKEPSLKWGQICLSFNETSEKVANWKAAEPHYTKTLDLIERLDHLNGLLCRLLACLVVFGSGNDREMWESVIRLGGDPRQARLKHTYKYLLTFAGAIVIAVMVGREVGVLSYNVLADPATPLEHFRFDTFRWMIYSVLMYILPIIVVFAARVEAYRMASADMSRYYGFYVLMTLVGFVTSASVSTLVIGLAAADGAEFSFLQSFAASMRWGIMPGLMCGFVAYQMDSPVDDSEPKSRMYMLALPRLAVWAALGGAVMLYATDNMPLEQPGLRWTVVVTTMFVSGLLGAVTRFKVVQTNLSARPEM